MNTTVKNGKLYNDKGEVAIAVSYGYGAGWSTWNKVSPLNPTYNALILAKDFDTAIQLAEEDKHYPGGLLDCEIEWMSEGTEFIIEEYDGHESIVARSDLIFITA